MSKRSLCFAAAMVFLTLSASALTAQTKWMGGPFVGLNYTTIAGDSVKDTGYRAGLAAGGQLQADFSEGMFFRTALLYSMRGATATVDGTKLTLKENFVEVPILLGYAFQSAGSTTTPFVMAGGQVGYKVACDIEGTLGGTKTSIKCDDGDTNFTSFDYAAVGGGGVMFQAAGGTMSIDARYAYGLKDITDSDKIKHRGFTFGVAYMIPFGR